MIMHSQTYAWLNSATSTAPVLPLTTLQMYTPFALCVVIRIRSPAAARDLQHKFDGTCLNYLNGSCLNIIHIKYKKIILLLFCFFTRSNFTIRISACAAAGDSLCFHIIHNRIQVRTVCVLIHIWLTCFYQFKFVVLYIKCSMLCLVGRNLYAVFLIIVYQVMIVNPPLVYFHRVSLQSII